ncbi:SusC/RagA family TonB-linked outer membrane protein [Albibacterium indicum]|uniref:SusC/RagA family TonB-linked outer membrane protein n=1 Tax=Albibacterium indicum TaxID=2292082 RepID=UPI000E52C29A|nr:TonB-dependent receptor [Pedobacter indicus]
MEKRVFKTVSFILLSLFLLGHLAYAQDQVEVKGIVTDNATQEPLAGVSVTLETGSQSVTTNAEGQFSISAPKASTLVFSYVGYVSQRVRVNGAVLNVGLEEELSELDEVVVVGYGTMRKSSLTSAISKIENEKLDQMPAGRPEAALVGRLAGVSITNSRNTPGTAPTIRIRGAGSISASNNPLVVIDGFPGGSLGNINMNDVESIEVLKDASSAAIYGSRGAGGVIMVTTKRGKSGKPTLNFNGYAGVANAVMHDDWIYGEEFHDYIARYINRDFVWEGGDPSLPLWGDDRRPISYRVNPVIKESHTNWEDVLLDPAAIQSYSLSVGGGNDNVKYYVSGNLMDEKGVLRNTGYKTYSARANIDIKVNDFISTGFNLSPTYAKRRRSPVSMEAIVKTAPFVSPEQNADGTYPKPRDYWGSSVSAQTSPLATLDGTHYYTTTFNSIGEMYVNVNILEGLSLRSTLGANIGYTSGDNFQSGLATSNGMNSGSASDDRGYVIVNENVLNYDKTINEDHYINAILGASFQKSMSRSLTMAAMPGSFNNEIIHTLNNAIINPAATRSSESHWGLASYFSRINYSYQDKYLLSASFRTDGSSRFGPNSRWGFFPSASVAWRMSQEEFLIDNPVISELKLRASYGEVGNFNIGDFQYLGLIGDGYYSPGGELTVGQAQSSLGNGDLKWETTTSYDIGLDLGLFDGRVNLIFDYYDKRTNDLLYNVTTPGISGFTTALVNIGDISNKGFEIELNTRNTVGEFKWQTAFNFSKNRNEVVDLGGVDEVINTHTRGMSWLLRVGEPMFSYYGYRQIGVLQNEEDVANSAVIAGSRPGHSKYEDVDGDGEITPNDRVILGNYQPKAYLGMTNDFSWKGLDLSVVLQASLGAKMYNLENLYYEGATVSAMRRSLVENQWWSEEEPGDGMTPATALSALAYVSNSDYYLEDASFLSIRNINLGYTFPNKLIDKMKLSNLRVYLSVNNLLTLTKDSFHGYNPEGFTASENNGINSMPGFNNGAEPINRTFVLGLNVNF